MREVALVTCRELADGYEDDRLALAPLAALEIETRFVSWTDEIDWSAFELVVLRSPWDWYLRAGEFGAWLGALERSGARVENAGAARWLDKTFLRALGERLIPTEWVAPGDERSLESIVRARGWERAVLKPSLSANAHRTLLFDAADAPAHEAALRGIAAGGAAMVQPYFEEVTREGEHSFVFLGGAFSHAVRKIAAPGDFRVQSDHGGSVVFGPEAPAPLVAQAAEALKLVAAAPLYARVDGVVRDGVLRVMELELVEPELFLRAHPEAPARFARAVAERVGRRRAAR